MFRNYLYLKRAVYELDSVFSGLIIYEAFTQEKDKLYLNLSDKNHPNRHLIISAEQNFPFLNIKNEHFKAKKNIAYFFEDHLPDKIISIKIALKDRIIEFEFAKSKLYFLVRGNKSNVILFSEKSSKSFKKISEEELLILKSEIREISFSNNLTFEIPEHLTFEIDYKKLKQEFPFINRDIFNEIKYRKDINSEEPNKKIIAEVFKEILVSKILVYQDPNQNMINFVPKAFKIFNSTHSAYIFQNYNEALSQYFKLFFKFNRINELKKEINKYLSKEMLQLSNKLNNLRSRIDRGSLENEYHKMGNLLLMNINSLNKGIDFIELEDYENGDKIKIKLDPKLFPQQNVNKYFEKARNEKIDFLKSTELYKSSQKRYDSLLEVKNKFENLESVDELLKLKQNLNLIAKQIEVKKVDEKIRAWHYIIEAKYHLYVGKDSKSNDLLTTKFAKQNDYWFHARGLPGSHVVLRVENTKEVIPKNVLRIAAQIAAYHSKAKTAGTAPVAYTFAKFVYKKKGLDPGQVIMKKENVLLVKPSIPVDVELIDE